MNRCLDKKIAGVMIPLFSIRTKQNFGNGEILDLLPFIDFMAETHLSLLQLLPINELAPGETSPYNALTAFAFDPIYISLHACVDFRESDAVQSDVKRWQDSPHIRWEEIRVFKFHVLEIMYDRFKKEGNSPRAKSFQSFIETQAEWLEEYALFRLIYEQHGGFINWPDSLRNRDTVAVDRLKEEESDRLLFLKYLQWIAYEQWQEVRAYARSKNIFIMGDTPFLISRESADVWSHPDIFPEGDLVGAPPDGFNEEGQFWGLPMFSFPKMEETDFQWWRQRIRFASRLYDVIRLDHLVGFFRTWVFPKEGSPYFEPGGEEAQKERGRRFLEIFLESAGDAMLVAEDLGVIPPFVNERLYKLHIPGIKIMRWQKVGTPTARYLHPKIYPWLSLATTGTHDTTPSALWWNDLAISEREAFLFMLDKKNPLSPEILFSGKLHQLIISRLVSASSMMAILPFQDILGLTDEINQPGTISEKNWCYRIPENIDSLCEHPLWKDKLAFLKTAILQSDRAGFASLVRLSGL
jgi:4-alpha-glucanotransferase